MDGDAGARTRALKRFGAGSNCSCAPGSRSGPGSGGAGAPACQWIATEAGTRIAEPAGTNSSVPGSPAGLLGTAQLAWIDDTLRARPDVPAVVCVHYPPVSVGMPHLDAVRLRDGPALGEVIASHPHIARVLSGHVRRALHAPFAGSMLAVAPSICRLVDWRVTDDEPPGFLLHLLLDDRHAANLQPRLRCGPAMAAARLTTSEEQPCISQLTDLNGSGTRYGNSRKPASGR